MERIQKVMAARGICSRRAAEVMIKAGRVKVNGRPISLGDSMDSAKDTVNVDNNSYPPQKRKKFLYLMLNKPRGYLTTASDERGRRTVLELLTGIDERVFPVGRLDMVSEGLLLLTNDGDFANLMTHPSHKVSKLYRTTVRPRATEEQVAKLASGVVLDDGDRTQPASVRVLSEDTGRSVLEISVKEGKNRQIRRMCEAVGLDVARLRRVALGPVKLGMLKPGQYRELTPAEINALRASASSNK